MGEGEREGRVERERPSATERGEPKGGIADRRQRECVMCASQMQPRHGQAHTYLPTVPYNVSLTALFSTSNVCSKSSDDKKKIFANHLCTRVASNAKQESKAGRYHGAKPAEILSTLVIPEWKATIVCNCTKGVLHDVLLFSHFPWFTAIIFPILFIYSHYVLSSLYCTTLLLTSCLAPGI